MELGLQNLRPGGFMRGSARLLGAAILLASRIISADGSTAMPRIEIYTKTNSDGSTKQLFKEVIPGQPENLDIGLNDDEGGTWRGLKDARTERLLYDAYHAALANWPNRPANVDRFI